MLIRLRRVLALATVFAAVSLMLVMPAAASNGATQISGAAVFHAASDGIEPAFTDECPGVPGYEDFNMFTLKLVEGNLQGCWYTLVETYQFSPSADASPVMYHETGREVFDGELYDDEGNLLGSGTFETTYRFTAQFEDATLAVEYHGRCQHPIVAGTGTGVFEGMRGRLDFKDEVETGTFYYRGHLKPTN